MVRPESRPRAAGPGQDVGPSPVLVGREAELERLVRAAAHPPVVVFLEGEAGVGKTRLVRELLGRPELRERRRHIGHCHPLREPFPLGPVIEAMRDAGAEVSSRRALSPVAGALRPLLPEIADLLPPPPDPLGDPRAERHRVFRALAELLEELGPTVLVLEDLHWSDEGTAEFLWFLTSRFPTKLALVLTYRREDLPEGAPFLGLSSRFPEETVPSLRLSLSPLDPDQVARLISAILGGEPVTPDFALYVYERTSGIPFAVEEVLRLLAERRDLVRERGDGCEEPRGRSRCPPRSATPSWSGPVASGRTPLP